MYMLEFIFVKKTHAVFLAILEKQMWRSRFILKPACYIPKIRLQHKGFLDNSPKLMCIDF